MLSQGNGKFIRDKQGYRENIKNLFAELGAKRRPPLHNLAKIGKKIGVLMAVENPARKSVSD